MFQFLQRITIGNPADFIQTAGRAPTSTIDAVLQGDIECGAIDACLSAGNYFHLSARLVAGRNNVRALDH